MNKQNRQQPASWTRPRRIDLSLQEIIADLRYPDSSRGEPSRRTASRRRALSS
ncbi:MAG: hypothetical protein KDB62_04220 [Solirubrobacterales bacterium]|nr:hypothetical protein [Solirubrobacterales bacterium]